MSPSAKDKRDAIVDDEKWSSAIALVRAYNDWQAAMREHDNDAFHPDVTKRWDMLQLADKRYKRMVKK